MIHRQKYSGVTDWYEGWQEPLYIGPYERIDQWGAILYSWWNGCRWSSGCATPQAAEDYCYMASSYQELKWRGRVICVGVPQEEQTL